MSWLTQYVSIFLVALLFTTGVMHTAHQREANKPTNTPLPVAGQEPSTQYYVHNELLALVENEEEAYEIATQYGIELKSVSDGLAVFALKDGQDVMELVRLGKENGWHEVQPNYLYELF